MIQRTLIIVCLVVAGLTGCVTPPRFRVTVSDEVLDGAYSGRLYVMVSGKERPEPRLDLRWVNPNPMFSKDVENWRPGTTQVLDASSLGFPSALDELEHGSYFVQAVARNNPDGQHPGSDAGDLYGAAVKIEFDSDSDIELHIDKVVQPRPIKPRPGFEFIQMRSTALSDFHGRDVVMKAGVRLPDGYEEDGGRRYPVLYMVPGFGSGARSVFMAAYLLSNAGSEAAGGVLIVALDATCYRGHSVFADSANNGPWGRALVDEFMPYIESKFQGDGGHRYAMGISSGGWSALWLQVTYPDAFRACYAHAPDPVDFTDFQGINLYRPGENMYIDESGQRRPLMRRGGNVLVWYDEFAMREHVLGPGGQLSSFEAVFSPRDRHGEPMRLWDRQTGVISTKVARSWESYDISLIMKKQWNSLSEKLAGKIHVYGGGKDSFYLDGAVEKLAETMSSLDADAEVAVYPDRGHELMLHTIKPMFERILRTYEQRD